MRLVSVVLATAVLAVSSLAADFWYGVDGAEPLLVDSQKVTVMFDDGFGVNQQQELVESLDRLVAIIDDQHVPQRFVVCSLSNRAGYMTFLDTLKEMEGVVFTEPYYVSPGGTPMLAGEAMCVAFDEDLTRGEIDSIAGACGATVDRELIGLENVLVLRNTLASGSRLVELANLLHELPQTRYAQPDFCAVITTNSYNLYDYYSDMQPHTKKVIGQFNEASVWDFAGLDRSVTVAVIDDGVAAHEDLPAARVLPGYDFAGGMANGFQHDDDPTPGPDEAHGMGCAGIVAASHSTDPAEGELTSSGVISVNPYVEILPVKIFTDEGNDSNMTVSDLADATGFAWTQGADILSNSWGFTRPDYPDQPVLNEAIERAHYFGRGGRGCPVIFSSGNTTWWFPDPYGVLYPARLDQCFAVGAVDLSDYRWDYSRYGPELDMIAPSDDGYTVGVWTLDQMGILGWNPAGMSDCPPGENDWDYDCHFGGTFAACPLVAGTAALLLAKDSTLTSSAVYYILRNSAVTDLDWGSIYPPDWQYGYGRVDAFRAVLSITPRNGDVDNSGAGPDISDLVYFVSYLFSGGQAPFPSELMADFNCDGGVDIADLVHLGSYMFSGGPHVVDIGTWPCFEFGD